MSKVNFKLRLGSALLISSQLILAGCGNGSNSNTPTASMVLKNGAIYTMDEENKIVTAVAIDGDRIIYVGDDTGVEQYVNRDTEVIDLSGKMVTPGFIDGHAHPPETELNEVLLLTLGDVEPTIESYQQALRDFRDANPDLDSIFGAAMQLNAFENGVPHRSVLDEIVSDIPVIISDSSGHGQLLNSKALELAGITKDTEDPAGGKVYKDSEGEPTGYLSDAEQLYNAIIERPEVTSEQFIEAFKVFEKDSLKKGITAAHTMYLRDINAEEIWKITDNYAATGEMSLRINWQIFNQTRQSAGDIIEMLNDGQQYNSDWQKVSTVKTIIDGVPEGKTAYLLEPYSPEADTPPDYRGESNWNKTEYFEFVSAIDSAGYQVQAHAMGDASARMFVDAVEQAYVENGQRDGRHVMVHANLIDSTEIPRMGELGIYAAMQPVWFYLDPIFSAIEIQMIGEERAMGEYAVRDMVESNITITGSADIPITPDNRPLAGIEVGVTRGAPYPEIQGNPQYVRNADQTVSVMDMLKVYTINGAKQMFMEDTIGSIEVDKKADLVILAQDITTIDPVDISETEIVKTIVDGKTVYSQE